MSSLTLDEEENLYANLVASAARGPLRRASLEVLVLEGNMEARRRLDHPVDRGNDALHGLSWLHAGAYVWVSAWRKP